MSRTTRRTTKATRPKPLTGNEVVVLIASGPQNGYVEQFNSTFGIIHCTPDKAKAARFYLSQAVDVIKDIERFGAHKVWAELI